MPTPSGSAFSLARRGGPLDHLDRYSIQAITPYTVAGQRALLGRLTATECRQPVVERQEHALGTVCAAIPVEAGPTAATMAIPFPVPHQERRIPTAERLHREVEGPVSALEFSLSI
jgi:DNA-binding IclR family transcriptional regulator